MKITIQKTAFALSGFGVMAALVLGTNLTRPRAASFVASGAVTPSGMKITITGASLIRDDNSELEVLTGSHVVEFLRSGAPFAAISMGSITVPMGRYVGMRLSFDDRYSVKLSGDAYAGGGAIGAGTALYTPTAVADSSASDSFSTTVSATTEYVTLPHVSNCTDCSATTYFAAPACVANSSDDCDSGDHYVGGDGTTIPDVNVIVDLYQSISIDAATKSISRGAVYPFAVVGRPGAAIHVASGGSSGTQNVSILFGSDKKIHSVATWSGGGSSAGPTGGSWVTATSGASVNPYGPTMLSDFDATTGKVQFPMGNCPSNTGCTSSGLAVLDNVLQAAGSTVNFTCTDDSSGALGYAYSGGNCSGINTGAMKVVRIVDPSNLFNICTTGGGICADNTFNGTTDGYL